MFLRLYRQLLVKRGDTLIFVGPLDGAVWGLSTIERFVSHHVVDLAHVLLLKSLLYLD